jgi:hypothetical protein
MPIGVREAGMVVLLLAERTRKIHRRGKSRVVLVQCAQLRTNPTGLGALIVTAFQNCVCEGSVKK